MKESYVKAFLSEGKSSLGFEVQHGREEMIDNKGVEFAACQSNVSIQPLIPVLQRHLGAWRWGMSDEITAGRVRTGIMPPRRRAEE